MTNIELETLSAIKAACRKYMSANEPCATPDWEQRRYEIAKDMMTSTYFGGNNGSPLYWQKRDSSNAKEMAQYAVIYADALIAELQKSNQ